jgi:hypothetical protein
MVSERIQGGAAAVGDYLLAGPPGNSRQRLWVRIR